MKIDDRVANYMAALNDAAVKPAVQSVTASGSRAIAETVPVAAAIVSAAVQQAEDEARRDRLNAIRQQLAEGTYNISGKDVANKILNVLKG